MIRYDIFAFQSGGNLRGGKHSELRSPLFPLALPLSGHAVVVRCGNVFMYWWGDGFYGVGDVTLRRFVLITCNFLPVNCLLLPAGSTSWQGVCCLTTALQEGC